MERGRGRPRIQRTPQESRSIRKAQINKSSKKSQQKKKQLEMKTVSDSSSQDEFQILLNAHKARNQSLKQQYQQILRQAAQFEQKIKKTKQITAELQKQVVSRQQINEGLTQKLKQLDQDYNGLIQKIKGNIRVYLRVKKIYTKSTVRKISQKSLELRVQKPDYMNIIRSQKMTFEFDHIFDQEDDQESVFLELSGLVQQIFQGKQICFLEYGQAGAGKTFTLLGKGLQSAEDDKNRGLVSRCIQFIFQKIEINNKKNNIIFQLYASATQIYGDKAINLFNGQSLPKENPQDRLIENQIQLQQQIRKAITNRITAPTSSNSQSSRSHLLLKFTVKGNNQQMGSLILGDLAGNENIQNSGAQGTTQKECISINKSLLVLNQVFSGLKNNLARIPYNQSCITRVLFSKVLQENCRMILCVNVSPAQHDVKQTKTSLFFARGARQSNVKYLKK